MNTLHGFADTVRFRGRGLMVDRAVSTGHTRIIRGGAVMPFTCCFGPACRSDSLNVFRRLVLDVISRTRGAI